MSAGVCIPDLIAQGKIPKGKAAEAEKRYQQLLDVYDRRMGGAAAEALATRNVLKALEKEALLKKRRMLLQVKAQQRIIGDVRTFRGADPTGPIDPRAVVALFDRDGRAGYSNVEGRRKAIRARAHAMMDGVLARFSSNVLGVMRNRAEMVDLLREAFTPGSTGKVAARELADAWGQAAEMLRRRFNAAGGDIGKIEDWGLPQSHDSRQIRAAGFEPWLAFIKPLLDRNRMINRETGEIFTDRDFDQVLREVWETIRSEGWNSRTAGGPGKSVMAGRHSDPRFLIFRDADGWLAYNEKFGAGTPFDAMMGHIDVMAREIAAMEVLGPNPNATVGWISDWLEKTAQADTAPDSKAVDRAFRGRRQVERLWDEITGASLRPENRGLALTFSAIRSVQTAAKLGSATLSAVSDLGFQFATRRYNGLPVVAMMKDYLKLIRPGAVEDQRLAVRLGLIAEEWSNRTAAQGRYLTEELTGETSRRLAEGVLRLSGLQRWTQAGRWAFGMEFLGHITDESVKAFDRLDPRFRTTLERYGFDAADWDLIRKTPLEIDRGVPWIKPQNVEDPALGDRLLEMILTETDYAVPMPDLRTRAMFNSIAPRGTIGGELVRSALQFKSFGVSVMISQMHRIMEQTAGNAARYAAGLIIATTVMGGLAVQLKLTKDGKDWRPMDDPKFWGAAALQGGGFGIFGDFLGSATNRFGGGFAQTLAGPLAQDVDNIMSAATAKDPVWPLLKTLKQAAPGQSLWYLKLGMDRLIADEIQQATDPNYRRSWRRMERFAREQQTQYWWAPGETAPERAPDLDNLGGEF